MSEKRRGSRRKVVVFAPVWILHELLVYVLSFAVFFGVFLALRLVGVAFLVALAVLTVARDVVGGVRHFAVGGYALLLLSFILEAPVPSVELLRSSQFVVIMIGAILCALIDSYGTRFVRWRALSFLFWASGRALLEWVPGLYKEFWAFLATGVVMLIYGIVFSFPFVGVAGVFVMVYMPVSLWVRAIRRSATAVYYDSIGAENPYEEALRTELGDSYWKTLVQYEPDYGVYVAYALVLVSLFALPYVMVPEWVEYALVSLSLVYMLYEGVKAWAWRAVEQIGIPVSVAIMSAVASILVLLFGGFPFGVMVSAGCLWLLALGFPSFRRYWSEVSAVINGKPFAVSNPSTVLLKTVVKEGKTKDDRWLEFVTRPLGLAWGLVLSLFAVFPVFAVMFGYSGFTVFLVYGATVLFAWCLLKQYGYSSVYLPVLATVYAVSAFSVWLFL